MRRLAMSLVAAVILAAAGLPLAPAAVAAPGPAESYLFVVDGSQIKVVPEKGNAGRIVITEPSAIRFSDRPYRHVRAIALRAMLNEFGWSPSTLSLADSTPNASISIAGKRSRVVDIGKAEIRKGKFVLHVIGIDGPLKVAKGAGSVFIDNADSAPTFPQSQSTEIYTNPTFGTEFTVVTTLTSATSATISLVADGDTLWTAIVDTSAPETSQVFTLGDGYVVPLTFDMGVSAAFLASAVSVNLSATIQGPDAQDNLLPPVVVSENWLFEL